MIGHDHDAVYRGNTLRRQLHRPELVPVFAKARHVRVEVGDLGALSFEQPDDVERGAFTYVFDVTLVGDTQHQDGSALNGLTLAIECFGKLPHPEERHLGVELAREIDEPRLVIEAAHLPREIMRIDRDTVATQPWSRQKLHEAERLGGGGLDDFPDVHSQLVADDRHLVYQADIHAAEGVLQQLDQL